MSRFTRIRLTNWRNFKSAEAMLERRVYLVGANASGKSNFFDAMNFLHDLTAVGGGFLQAVDKRGGIATIRSLSATGASDIAIEVGIDIDGVEWSYAIRFTQERQRQPMLRNERVIRDDVVLIDRPDAHDLADPERLTQTFLEQVQANQSFRAIAEFFAAIKYVRLVPQSIRAIEQLPTSFGESSGGDLLKKIARTPSRTRAARVGRIGEALRIAVPHLANIEFAIDESGRPHLRATFDNWQGTHNWQLEDQHSDGMLRLFGLLWVVQDGDGPLLLEEPELSLHVDVVRMIPQMLYRAQSQNRRQIMVSTHSPELVNDPGIGLDEVLLLDTRSNSTTLLPAASVPDAELLVNAGVSLADIVIAHTSPKQPELLALFGN